jgi:hypothetical protein
MPHSVSARTEATPPNIVHGKRQESAKAEGSEQVPASEQAAVLVLTIEELRRLHAGVLARYGLRPSELTAWKAMRGR